MTYDYIRRYYQVDPRVGGRVRHRSSKRFGTVANPVGDPQYVSVKFDGDRFASNAHPIELDYLEDEPA